jgi:hypothetical protein
MDKKVFENNVKSSLQVMLYVYQTKHGRNSDPKISNLVISWFGDNDSAAEVNFDTEYVFDVSDPDVGVYMRALNECDDKQFNFFTGIEIGQDGEFVKRFTPIDDSDDMVGYFKSSEYEWGFEGEKNGKATFSYTYNYFPE